MTIDASKPATPRQVGDIPPARTVHARVAARRVLGGAGSSTSGPDLVLLELEALRLARTVRPGQFVRARVGDVAQPFHVATRWERGIGLLVRPGWGISGQVAALAPGRDLELTGPLGTAFRPAEGRPIWHVAAPGRLHALLLAAADAGAQGGRVLLTEVGREPEPWWSELLGPLEPGQPRPEWVRLDRLPELEARLSGLAPAERPVLRAAGPMPFLAEVARLASACGLPLQVTVEQPMPCGVGVCLGCVVPRRGGTGARRWARACREGPVFEGEELDWEQLAGRPTAAPELRVRPASAQTPAAAGADQPPKGLPDGPLNLRLGSVWLRNPLMPASGCFGYGREMAAFYPLRLLGAVVTKGVSLAPWEGRPTPRVAWTAGGMLNAIGLQNPGVGHFLAEDLPFLVAQGAAVVVNVVGETVDEYAAVAARLEAAPRFPGDPPAGEGRLHAGKPYTPGHGGLAALELNISCPNVDAGGLHFGHDPTSAAAVVRAVRKACSLPLWVKLSPQGPVVEVARAVVEAGAEALSVANTLQGLALDPRTGHPRLAVGPGGLSGPPLKPVALALVHRLHRELPVPLIGIGGIRTLDDALEYRWAGAAAVAVGSAHFTDPYVLLKLRRDLLADPQAWQGSVQKDGPREVRP